MGFKLCTTDAATFQQMVEKECIYDFLASLDVKYDPIQVQVLGHLPLPNLREAYACIQQEESRQSAMIHRSALVAIPTPRDGKSTQAQLVIKVGLLIKNWFSVTIAIKPDIQGNFVGS